MGSCSSLPVRAAVILLPSLFLFSAAAGSGPSEPLQPIGEPPQQTSPGESTSNADQPRELPSAPSDPPTLRIPDVGQPAAPPLGQPPAGQTARDKILELIEGEEGAEETGDPVLDGVLDLLRTEGSVLDGSSLDPRLAPQPLPENRRLPESRLPPDRWPPYVDGDGRPQPRERDGREGADDTARYLLAEQLLRTARMLAAEPPLDSQRRRLIEDLRREAIRSLSASPLAPPDYGLEPAGHAESF